MLDPRPSLASGQTQGHSPHAVVIGAGFGGLAAAIRLIVRGYRVTVLEKLDAAGGRGYVHRRDGFTFDAGPTIVTAPFLFEELWTLCGRRMSDDVTLLPMMPFYRIRFDSGESFDFSDDQDAMRRQIAAFNPADVGGYDRYMAMSEAIFRVGFEQLADVSFDSWTVMARIVPQMVRLKSYRSVYGLVSDYFQDERLRQVFSFHPLLIGGNPFTVRSIYCLIAHLERHWGVHFAMGGTGRIAERLVALLLGQGGVIRYNTHVRRILVDKGRACGVQLASGETVAADVVVSNADSAMTYYDLLPEENRKRWTNRKIERAAYSMSLFVWYFGTKRRYDDVAHHTIILGPRYKELLRDIFDRKIVADDFSLYLHRPTATDPSLAPPGCDTFYVLSPVPHLGNGMDWSVAAEPYRKRIEAYLSRTLLPGLENELATSFVTTPADFNHRLSSFNGAAFGLEPLLTQSAWFRPHNRSEEVDRLYLVGAGTHPGAGLPGVLSSARILDSIVPDVSEITAC